MKLIWREHKRTCQRMEQAANAVDALTEDLSKVELDDKRRWWLLFNPDDQELIAKCMHVVSLCRIDAAMTGRAERREWQKALKNLKSVALNKWPHYSSANKFKGLKWCQLRRIKLQGFQLERVVYKGVPQPREKHFGVICNLGFFLWIEGCGECTHRGRGRHQPSQYRWLHSSLHSERAGSHGGGA